MLGEGTARAGVAGDWGDLDAAVSAAASRSELAVERRESPEEGVRVYVLRSVASRPGRLEAVRAEDGSIVLTASIGRFGDPAAETRLVRDVATRLRQLQGVDSAPIRW